MYGNVSRNPDRLLSLWWSRPNGYSIGNFNNKEYDSNIEKLIPFACSEYIKFVINGGSSDTDTDTDTGTGITITVIPYESNVADAENNRYTLSQNSM